MKTLAFVFMLATSTLAHAAAPLDTVPIVDISRYMGTWYDVASFPAPFQKDCYSTSASYKLRGDGTVDVLNRCRKGSFSTPWKEAKARAWVVDKTTNAKLKVRFFWPFTGDYWIIDLGKNYEYAVVSEPRRRYLWILSRTPHLPPEELTEIKSRLNGRGFDLSLLRETPQP